MFYLDEILQTEYMKVTHWHSDWGIRLSNQRFFKLVDDCRLSHSRLLTDLEQLCKGEWANTAV